MITSVSINDFKCIDSETLKFRPITILTGCNSVGKSSVIQAILAVVKNNDAESRIALKGFDFSFGSIRNRFKNAKIINIRISLDNGGFEDSQIKEHGEGLETSLSSAPSDEEKKLRIEKNLYYLNANRQGFADFEIMAEDYKVGTAGEFVMGTFEKEKNKPLIPRLVVDDASSTLEWQVNHWLSYILNQKLGMKTEAADSTHVKTRYNSEGLAEISPRHLGVGVSYLAKTIITCLRAKEGDIIIIENPEIHLHPAAQARLAEFFAFIANAGIQVIIETHCEHLLNKFQHLVYSHKLKSEDIILFYKAGILIPFEPISISPNGKYEPEFPQGFFDATLAELIDID